MNPGIKCATKRESIEYFKTHLEMFQVGGIERYIDFYDFMKPFKFKPRNLMKYNSSMLDESTKSNIYELIPNEYELVDSRSGLWH